MWHCTVSFRFVNKMESRNLQRRKKKTFRNFHHSPRRWGMTFQRESGLVVNTYTLPRVCWKPSSPMSMAWKALCFQKIMASIQSSQMPSRFILLQATIGWHPALLDGRLQLMTANSTAAEATTLCELQTIPCNKLSMNICEAAEAPEGQAGKWMASPSSLAKRTLESWEFWQFRPNLFSCRLEFWTVGLNPGPVRWSRFVAKTL